MQSRMCLLLGLIYVLLLEKTMCSYTEMNDGYSKTTKTEINGVWYVTKKFESDQTGYPMQKMKKYLRSELSIKTYVITFNCNT